MSSISKKDAQKKLKEEKKRIKEEQKRLKKENKQNKKKGAPAKPAVGQVIGSPTNFSHDTHVGWDTEHGFEVCLKPRVARTDIYLFPFSFVTFQWNGRNCLKMQALHGPSWKTRRLVNYLSIPFGNPCIRHPQPLLLHLRPPPRPLRLPHLALPLLQVLAAQEVSECRRKIRSVKEPK